MQQEPYLCLQCHFLEHAHHGHVYYNYDSDCVLCVRVFGGGRLAVGVVVVVELVVVVGVVGVEVVVGFGFVFAMVLIELALPYLL
jgi:hypothetical protein